MRILVVDDEPDVVESVRLGFTLQWREVDVLGAGDGEAALDAVEQEHPDIVLLDVGLPDIDGFEVLRQIREFSDVPVLMLTARDDAMDKVKGLELGADDYVTKPFNHLELMARVKAVLRRLEMPAPTSRAPSFQSGDLEVDFAKQEARLSGERLDLTPTEYKLLYHLVRNAGHILSHGTLLAKVWGREYVDEVDYMRVYIRRLRDKLGDAAGAPALHPDRARARVSIHLARLSTVGRRRGSGRLALPCRFGGRLFLVLVGGGLGLGGGSRLGGLGRLGGLRVGHRHRLLAARLARRLGRVDRRLESGHQVDQLAALLGRLDLDGLLALDLGHDHGLERLAVLVLVLARVELGGHRRHELLGHRQLGGLELVLLVAQVELVRGRGSRRASGAWSGASCRRTGRARPAPRGP